MAAKSNVELRVFVNDQCIVADEPFYLPQSANEQNSRFLTIGIGSLLVRHIGGALLSKMVSSASSGLRSRGKRKDTTFVLAEGVHLYQANLLEAPKIEINPAFGCVTVVGGSFAPEPRDCKAQYVPRTISDATLNLAQSEWQTDREDSSVENVLRRANICLDGPARSVLEGRVDYSDDHTAFRLQKAGLWINGLLSTTRKNVNRHVLYTLDIFEPGSTEQASKLATLWMNVGEVNAREGLVSLRAANSDWIRIPELSSAAQQAYESDSAVHQELYAEIAALERSLTRDQRMAKGLQQRMADASEDAQDALQAEVGDLEIRILRAESMLDALRLEYSELDHESRFYMPVNVEIGVTEARSESRAMTTLAELIEDNRDTIATVAGEVAGGFSRSFATGEPPVKNELDLAREAYFDALIAIKTENTPAGLETAELVLQNAKQRYNAARIAIGLESVK
jgi:hypothetical protein